MDLSYTIKKIILKIFGGLQIFKYPFFIVWGHTSYKVKGEDVRKILDIIKPGDILLRRYDHYVTGLLIPGHFTHAAMYTGENKITHMVGSGIGQEDILTFCRCDDICIIRCKDESRAYIAIEYAFDKLKQNVAYDFDFDFSDPNFMSCTELVSNAFDMPKTMRKIESVISPDDLLNLPGVDADFEIIYRKG